MGIDNNLSNRFKEVFLDGKWIANTNWQDKLADVTFQQATEKVEDLNTISLLTWHVNYYIEGLIHFFESGELTIRDKFSFDMPVLNSDIEWSSLKSKLTANAKKFVSMVETMTDEKLASNFVKEEYGTYARNIEAMIEHGYYHLGQVSLIKKMVQGIRQKS